MPLKKSFLRFHFFMEMRKSQTYKNLFNNQRETLLGDVFQIKWVKYFIQHVFKVTLGVE